MTYRLEETSGTEYPSLEECQQGLIEQLARLLTDIIREAAEGENSGCDKIGAKTLEADSV